MTKIFESPDKGKTVYARDFRSTTRELVQTHFSDDDGELFNNILRKIQREKLWDEIFKEAERNPTLQTALEQCIMIYKLSKEYKEDV